MSTRYERHYGHRYGQAETVREVAATVRKGLRADLKDAANDPQHPLAGVAKVSVRYRTASMMQAVDVDITYEDHAIHRIDPNATPHFHTGPDGYIDETLYECRDCGAETFVNSRTSPRNTNRVEAAFAYIGFQLSAFNHDGSDTMTDYFDVRFYSTMGAKNPDREYSDVQTIPSVWRRHVEDLRERRDDGDSEAGRILDHDAMMIVCAASGI